MFKIKFLKLCSSKLEVKIEIFIFKFFIGVFLTKSTKFTIIEHINNKINCRFSFIFTILIKANIITLMSMLSEYRIYKHQIWNHFQKGDKVTDEYSPILR